MNQFILLASIGSDLAQTARDTAEKFGLDAPHFFAQVISFLIVAALLYRFAYQPILTVLEERRQRIAEGLENAEKIKAELARTEAARRKILDQTNDHGQPVDRGSASRRHARARAGNAKSHRRRGTNRGPGARSRRAGS